MAKVCQVTGKRPSTGHKVSHSQRKTKRRFLPNLIKKRIKNPITGKMERMVLSTKALKTLIKRAK